jgi:hypothetical protein
MTAGEIASLCVAAATLVSALAGLVVAVRTGAKVEATHTLVNGQSGALNALTGKAAYAEGVLAGSASQGAENAPHDVSDHDASKNVSPPAPS